MTRLVSLALLAAGGFYMVCIYSFGTILDWHEFVKSPVPALACLKGINMLLYLAMLVIATLGPMGPMNSFYGATSRIMLAMGRKGQLPEKFAEVDPKSGAPKLACAVLGVITVIGPFLGTAAPSHGHRHRRSGCSCRSCGPRGSRSSGRPR